ncbi:Putative hydroxylase/desaturase AsaB [Colletotrichum destructivum]|uniref:Hydroxylase/desaturase AsaB n=1 Tax=Colletotrichum destructivum TaxID=34406 RepID=A0AAX4J2Q5_9PEZI|nr:Putative hydroxylase/desaturase AsaB [Colletotrichum destructivum]
MSHQGIFRYLPPNAKPASAKEAYLLPSLSEFSSIVTLPLTDLKPTLDLGDASPYKLSVHGFTARRHHSALHAEPFGHASWKDERALRDVHFPEVEEFVKKLTGCKTAVVSAAVVRTQPYSEGTGDSSSSAEDGGKGEGEREEEEEGEEDSSGTTPKFPPIVGLAKSNTVSPAPKVHLDLTPKGARLHIRKYAHQVTSAAEHVITAENALLSSGVRLEDLKDHYHEAGVPRFALFSIWRPIKTVKRDPLALAPANKFPEEDYVVSAQLEPLDRTIPAHLSRVIGPQSPDSASNSASTLAPSSSEETTYDTEGYLAYAPKIGEEGGAHDWHFIADQEPSEVLVIQLFDNEMEANARAPRKDGGKGGLGVGGTVHSAFELVGQDGAEEARESIEVRVAAFW